MAIWKTKPELDLLNQRHAGTMAKTVGIEFTETGDDSLQARMPVDDRTKQPLGLLHGGATATLAETLGSVASMLCINLKEFNCVGLELNVNHLKSAREGYVTGRVTPIRIGRTIHVWDIRVTNEEGELTAVSRLTVAVVPVRDSARPSSGRV